MASDAVLNKHYQDLFDEFNLRYFDGRLPPYRVRVVERIPSPHRPVGICSRNRRQILLRKEDSNNEMSLTLLPEMAHTATTEGHGPRWLEEMKRLQSAGVPFPETELQTSPRVTKQFIRVEAQDALLHTPSLTSRQFVRWLVIENGLQDSQAALLRRWPWVPCLFSETKKEVRKYLAAVEALKQTSPGREGDITTMAVTVRHDSGGVP